ncbi:uroporphyrinogen-III synthase [Sphingomonas mollis]|uniref:Uroporphyrinogen-III synthase n=1 Tax=Sphingomonas mollis TaxID=2795726 RepID=A0ABS0XRQ6_9SPHN|nr:uroporphyrinogen-III synthase [Sphingomonas sp. BT553]MBJ6122740.1 uroporphyrinogen-III synthase [Sphingomonas sp. BT553]
MRRPLIVLRPEPGNARTAAAIEALGGEAIRLPLFTIEPRPWHAPDPAAFDVLLATSANAFRQGGAGLAGLRDLPVWAVGATTAEAARAAGFTVARIGEGDGRTLALTAPAGLRMLHLAGKERIAPAGIAATVMTRSVYAAPPTDVSAAAIAGAAGGVALLYSTRAARRWAELVDLHRLPRDTIRLATIGKAVATAAGDGWNRVAAAAVPTDAAVVTLALGLSIDAE